MLFLSIYDASCPSKYKKMAEEGVIKLGLHSFGVLVYISIIPTPPGVPFPKNQFRNQHIYQAGRESDLRSRTYQARTVTLVPGGEEATPSSWTCHFAEEADASSRFTATASVWSRRKETTLGRRTPSSQGSRGGGDLARQGRADEEDVDLAGVMRRRTLGSDDRAEEGSDDR